MDVTCHLQPLVPTKTAAGEWDRTVTWTLAKLVDDDSHSGYAGDSFDSTWTVVADKTDSGSMNFVVAGTIEVYNPAAIAQTFTVSDILNDVAATAATVDCPNYTVDPGRLAGRLAGERPDLLRVQIRGKGKGRSASRRALWR